MSKQTITAIAVIALCLAIVGYGMVRGTPLAAYTPQNQDEAEIIDLVSQWHRAGQAYDPAAYLACLDPGGRFLFAGGEPVSKAALAKALPKFWDSLRAGDMTVKGFSRESLNGDFLKGRLYDPKIRVDGHRARATVKFVTPGIPWRTLLFLEFEKTDKAWLITRYEWDMG